MPRTFVWHPKRGPARTERGELTSGKVRVEQVRSGIGQTWRMRRTLEALGLRHHQDVAIHQDSPSLRGQIKAVRHLVKVTSVDDVAGRQSPVASDQQKRKAVSRKPSADSRKRKNNDGK